MTDLKILPQKVKGSNKRDENKPEKTGKIKKHKAT